ncbi:MAG: glutamate--tRNA ligase [Campylobacterales bacterium]|nr:glutamate--tRNA ligase [Campylobacterales bacterium]
MLRFAPSPTGDMHIGNLRVAILNYIVAKQIGEKFLIRIEDTDKERNIDGKDEEILDILHKFGLKYDNLVYQSKNLHFHQTMAMQLIAEQKAFLCFCTADELDRKKELAKANNEPFRYDGTCEKLSNLEVLDCEKPSVVRLKKPQNSIKFVDKIKGEQSFEPKDIDSFVILRTDKTPTYNFACAIDDMLYDISFIIRGEDHVSNSPKQIHIRNSLGYSKEIVHAHLPIILNDDGKKMSKRDNVSSVKYLLDEGFLVEAITNYLVALGNTTPTEIFNLSDAIEWFKIENISKSPARFDIDKLKFINREHIKLKDDVELSRLIGFGDENIGKLIKLYTQEGSTIKEIKAKIDAIFSQKDEYAEFKEEFELLKQTIKNMPFFEDYEEFKKELTNRSGLKGKNLFKPLRFLLTGAENGPELKDVYVLIKNYLMEVVK